MTINKNNTGDFLYSGNEDYIAELYEKYSQNPASVSEDWQAFFANLGDRSPFQRMPQWSNSAPAEGISHGDNRTSKDSPHTIPSAAPEHIIALQKLIHAYRMHGHTKANLDPLGLVELNPVADLAMDLDPNMVIPNEFMPGHTVGQIIEQLETIYCQDIGYEYMHLEDVEARTWIQSQVEQSWQLDPTTKKETLKQLIEVDVFETFLHTKYVGSKRFSLEGMDSVLPALEYVLNKAANDKMSKVILGMAHRGRLNILANVVGKPVESLLQEFEEHFSFKGSGDVKYHLGYAHERVIQGHRLSVELLNNPSHLESVNSVLLGSVRAHQSLLKDEQCEKVLGIILHGDAAFAAQGAGFEALVLTNLPQYTVGGILHIMLNNQIGFTTRAYQARSSRYSTDTTKVINMPVFHVNGEKPEAVMRCMALAYAFRQQFKQDVVVEIWGYRKHGHNETDDPFFTQPAMYRKISTHTTIQQQYQDLLIAQQIVTVQDIKKYKAAYHRKLEKAYRGYKTYKQKAELPVWKEWTKHFMPSDVSVEDLRYWGFQTLKIPEGFIVHKRLERMMIPRQQALESGMNIDWATAEMLAFASLLVKKIPVRLSGEDSARGTFSQRHSIFVETNTAEHYIPLNHIAKNQALFEVCNSPLSEMGVLGFEYGYSISNPHQLVIWEAQFGDFANGAQIMIDQYIAAGEDKWNTQSGLVLLLPHGYEGQGPEHSSARLERFLQLYTPHNIIVANCTTPANYFHILRQQVLAPYRKPLILMTPKSLLRHKMAVSTLKDMSRGTVFHPVLEDLTISPKLVQRVILCCGKVYYDLLAQRHKLPIALIRLEQLAPFPKEQLLKVLKPYSQAEIVWCQEEPRNMGAWAFVAEQMEQVLALLHHPQLRPIYIGRPPTASVATGSLNQHVAEMKQLLHAALTITPFKKRRVNHGH